MTWSRLLPTALIAGLALMLLTGGGSGTVHALPPFTPSYSQTIDEVAPSDPLTLPSDDDCPVGSPCKSMYHLTIPDGQPGVNFYPGVNLRLVVPSTFVAIAGDALVPNGAIVGRNFGSQRSGLVGNCDGGPIGSWEEFFYDATTDPATATGSTSDLSSFENWPTQLNGVRDDVLNDNPGSVLHARWMFDSTAQSEVWQTNVLLFQMSGGGFIIVAISGDPTAPAQFQNCGPYDSNAMRLAVSKDNPDTGPDEGGIPLSTCTTAGTQTYQLYVDRNDTPPGDEVTLFDTATCSTNTPSGSNVSVPLLGGTESVGGMEVTFSEVTNEGSTSVTGGSEGPPPPTGFEVVGLSGQSFYYDINTTATFSGPVTVCVKYDDSGLTAEQEAGLRLMQNASGEFLDRTSSVDTAGNIICGTADSFSVWAVMAPASVGGIVELRVGGPDPAVASPERSARDYAAPVAAALAAGAVALAAGGWYGWRRRVR